VGYGNVTEKQQFNQCAKDQEARGARQIFSTEPCSTQVGGFLGSRGGRGNGRPSVTALQRKRDFTAA
jgi:hypothetical protein